MARRPDQQQYRTMTKGDYPQDGIMLTGPVSKRRDLKYARNPGSTAALYVHESVSGPCIVNAEIIPTKNKTPPGYINLEDANRALRTARKLKEAFPSHVTACVVKHEIPCGAGRGYSPSTAFLNAWAGDSLSAFGGVVAVSEKLDDETARLAAERQPIEWIVAPGYTDEAMDVLRGTNIRLMQVESFDNPFDGPSLEVRDVDGGYLVGDRYDSKIVSPAFIEVKFGSPTEEDFKAAIIAWLVAGQTKSNSVVIGDAHRAYGIGSGQTSRVDAAVLALYKAAERDWSRVLGEERWAQHLVAASDAFFPFPDGPQLLAKAGVRGCIYPTGSNRDEESFEVFRQNNMFVMIPRPNPDDPVAMERAFY